MKKYKISYLIFILSLFLTACDKEVFTGFEENKTISTAAIYVDSYPQNFKIYLDGQISGFTTPDTLKFLEEGSHQITLRKELYRDTSLIVGLVDAQTKSIFVDVLSNPVNRGRIECSSSPENAAIFINDSATGLVTPEIFSDLIPGEYNIEFELAEHRGRNITVTVAAQTRQTIHFALDDTTTWVKYNVGNSDLSSNAVSCVTIDNNNHLWVGTDNNGIIHFDGKDWVTYNGSNVSVIDGKIYALTVDVNNNIYAGLANSLIVFNGLSWQKYSLSPYTSGVVSELLFDADGILWIATSQGLISYNGLVFTLFDKSDTGLPNDEFTSLALDINGDVWLGLRQIYESDAYIGGGIAKYDGVSFVHYDSSVFGSNFENSIGKIKVGPDGTKWIGHLRNLDMNELGGLSFYDGITWEEIEFPLDEIITTQPRINAVYVSKNNIKWCGTTHYGLLKFNSPGGTKEFFTTTNSGISGNKIIDIAEDYNGNLWLAVFGAGIVKLKVNKL